MFDDPTRYFVIAGGPEGKHMIGVIGGRSYREAEQYFVDNLRREYGLKTSVHVRTMKLFESGDPEEADDFYKRFNQKIEEENLATVTVLEGSDARS